MQKWEYLFVFYAYEAERDSWYPTYISELALEEELRDAKQDEAANFLGEQGWEMVSYAPITSTLRSTTVGLHSVRVVFKRPKHSHSTEPVKHSRPVY